MHAFRETVIERGGQKERERRGLAFLEKRESAGSSLQDQRNTPSEPPSPLHIDAQHAAASGPAAAEGLGREQIKPERDEPPVRAGTRVGGRPVGRPG